MDRIQQKITVDLTNGSNEVVYCNQYDDNSREIVISLENNGNIFKDFQGFTVEFRMFKTNGYGFSKNVGEENFGTVGTDSITIPINVSMSICPGRQKCELGLKDKSGMEIYTTNFSLQVKKSVIQREDMLDESRYDSFEQIRDAAEKYADLSKSYAIGTNGQTRLNDATDNSKYYSEKSNEYMNASKTSADASAVSENNAKESETKAKESEINVVNQDLTTKKYMEETERIYSKIQPLDHKIYISQEEPTDGSGNDEWLYFY